MTKSEKSRLVQVDGASLVRDSSHLGCTSSVLAFVRFITLPKITARLIKGADLGCGVGSLSLLLLEKHDRLRMTGVDLFPGVIGSARESAIASGQEKRFRADVLDVREISGSVPAETFHLVVSNPPHYRLGEARLARDEQMAAARHETAGGLADFLAAAAHLVKPCGHVAILQRASRVAELITTAAGIGLVVSRLQFIYTETHPAAEEVMVEFRRRPPRGVEVLPPVRLDGGVIC